MPCTRVTPQFHSGWVYRAIVMMPPASFWTLALGMVGLYGQVNRTIVLR